MSSVLLNAAAAKAAESPLNLFPDPANCNLGQIFFLIAVYGYVLFQASNLISDGGELLLLVPPLAPIVGSVVLPVLGAVPDGMMVLFSGLGPDAQNQVSVGVGALAGSTVMLLTFPWFLAVLAGRVSLKDGQPTYQRPPGADPLTWDKLSPPGNLSLLQTGVSWGPEIAENAKIMLLTLIPYVIIQGVSFTVDTTPKIDDSRAELVAAQQAEASAENMYALFGLAICIVQFCWYMSQQWNDIETGGAISDSIAETTTQALKDGTLTLRGAMSSFRTSNCGLSKKGSVEEVLLDKESMDEVRRMCKILKPFFSNYDINGDGTIDFEEFRMIFKDVGENIAREAQAMIFDAADADKSGDINFEEFIACLVSFALDPSHDLQEVSKRRYSGSSNSCQDNSCEETGEDGEEEEDVPEDLACLDPQEQQRRIMMRSANKMALGTLLVLFFSDPMVDLLSELGKRLDVSAFYISFLLAPLASNASELVAAYNYAKKRTRKSITTSLSTLEGAAIMNNTFCLGIFLGLVYFQNLAWEFSAETISICFVQAVVALSVISRTVHRLLDACIVLSFYPICLGLVCVLENYCGMD
eukprot:TRINITY_DN23262_c0_g1_i1.p1 TRINITY_DN23262_c0_g1~~TRINITY_DN23262_c0_g1_i1.p1  ORF type:complete len:596 (-),score=103.53 TRINITY_DN23262_c0_g1_i1:50-1801(-)